MTEEIKQMGDRQSEILLYQTEDGSVRIDVRLIDESVWLTQRQMCDLFQKDKRTVSEHIRNIFKEGELNEHSVVRKFRTTGTDGKNYETLFYNLDVIISVGYRVKSLRGTQFRIWATQRLREYIIKGFALDDRRLKEDGGGTYFDELLARIRDIRSSEKVFYKKVLEIYATSIDYDHRAESTQLFFKTVQNKMHWAAHGHTATEVIFERADADQPHMGLTAWAGNRPRKADATVAKNYLSHDEIDLLNRIVTLYLDFAELQAKARRPMHMKDWVAKLDDFLKITERDILDHSGKVSQGNAKLKAEAEFDRYRALTANESSLVEKHFEEAIRELKTLKRRE